MIYEALAMAAPEGGNKPSGGLGGMFLPIIVIFGIFYFLIIRPQKKRELNHRKFLGDLKKGDEVITQSGVYGRVANIADHVVTLDLGGQMKVRVAKVSIAGPQPVVDQKQT